MFCNVWKFDLDGLLSISPSNQKEDNTIIIGLGVYIIVLSVLSRASSYDTLKSW